jgi:hypothetical protein
VQLKLVKKRTARHEMPESLYETAKQLVENSVEVLMQEFGVDRKTAQYWVSSATGERQMSDAKESLIGRLSLPKTQLAAH